MIVSIIVARASNDAIGINGKLPWYLPSDLRHFKNTTKGHHVVMGRKTFVSLGKPLPGRPHIVVTSNTSFEVPEGHYVAHSIEEALQIGRSKELEKLFILGGAEIYKLALPFTDEMIITEIDACPEADTFFPKFDSKEWQIVQKETIEKDDKNKFDHAFVTYKRIGS
ncbi:dihydrofolate reductase [Cyclobacterium sp.]|uniref:dihydrofolate reductase n=1 Tax=Cyclobacterium sp. TaxID=1966343 RepID=UPI0019897517|nr:dihydrofolate reductase [Cyclobacterium sp.]MBD3627198.1 dihydrofolate reductase [Cyclobacterium sp.]